MSANSAIEWTDRTWNPVRGCSIVSPGCINCYAMKQAHRFSGPGRAYAGLTKLTSSGPQWTGKVVTVREAMMEPLRWRKPQRIFVNSMSDLFHEGVPDQFIVDVFGVMALAHWHTFQILTKRPERMRQFLSAGDHGILAQFQAIQDGGGVGPKPMFAAIDIKRRDGIGWQWPLPNVWLGVSCEDQQRYEERCFLLAQTPAAVRFLSCEPLLGPIDVSYAANGIDWVIVGGESGPGARPCDVAWIHSIVQQCQAAGVPAFVKQVGADPRDSSLAWTGSDLMTMEKRRSRKGGDPSEWPEDLRVRQFPAERQKAGA